MYVNTVFQVQGWVWGNGRGTRTFTECSEVACSNHGAVPPAATAGQRDLRAPFPSRSPGLAFHPDGRTDGRTVSPPALRAPLSAARGRCRERPLCAALDCSGGGSDGAQRSPAASADIFSGVGGAAETRLLPAAHAPAAPPRGGGQEGPSPSR